MTEITTTTFAGALFHIGRGYKIRRVRRDRDEIFYVLAKTDKPKNQINRRRLSALFGPGEQWSTEPLTNLIH